MSRPFVVGILILLMLSAVSLLFFRGSASVDTTGEKKSTAEVDAIHSDSAASFEIPTIPETFNMSDLEKELMEEAQRLSEFYPRSIPFLDLCASLYYNLNRLELAEQLWSRCISLTPSEPEYYLNYSRFLLRNDRVEDAITVIEKAHSNSLETAGTQLVLASAWYQDGQAEQAAELAVEINNRFPEYGEGWLLTGKVMNYLGRFSDSELSLRRALEFGQSEFDVFPVLITVLARQGKQEEAKELSLTLRKGHNSTSDSNEAPRETPFQVKFEESLRGTAARFYLKAASQEKRYWNNEEVLRLTLRGLSLQPDEPAILVFLAEHFLEVNRTSDALATYKRLTEVQPENLLNFTNLASLAIREHNQALALETLETATNLFPETIALKIPLAKLYLSLQKPLEAREVAQSILRLQPNPEAWMLEGASFQLTGQMDEAEKAFQKAREISQTLTTME